MTINSLGLTEDLITGNVGPAGRGVANVVVGTNGSGEPTLTFQMTDGTTLGPFTIPETTLTTSANQIVQTNSSNQVISSLTLPSGTILPSAASSIVQTDSSSNLTASNTLNEVTITASSLMAPNLFGALICGDLTLPSNGSYSVGTSSNRLNNVCCNSISLGPDDSSWGQITSHVTGNSTGSSVQIGVYSTTGLLIDGSSNAEIGGDTFYKTGGGGFTSTSDRNLKENITDFTQGLDVITKIQCRNYNYIADKNKKPRVGIIAQELQEVYPKAIFKGNNDLLLYDSSDLLYVLINSVKELKSLVDKQNVAISQLQGQVKSLLSLKK